MRTPSDKNVTFSHGELPYDVFCVGVKYNGRDYVNYELYADVSWEWQFPLLLVIGAAMFFSAKALSR